MNSYKFVSDELHQENLEDCTKQLRRYCENTIVEKYTSAHDFVSEVFFAVDMRIAAAIKSVQPAPTPEPTPAPFAVGDRVKIKGHDRHLAPCAFGVIVPGECSIAGWVRVRFDEAPGNEPEGMPFDPRNIELDPDHPSLTPAVPDWFAVGRKVVQNREPYFPEIWPAEIASVHGTWCKLRFPNGNTSMASDWVHTDLAPYVEPAPEPAPPTHKYAVGDLVDWESITRDPKLWPATITSLDEPGVYRIRYANGERSDGLWHEFLLTHATPTQLEAQVKELQAERDALQGRIGRALKYCSAFCSVTTHGAISDILREPSK